MASGSESAAEKVGPRWDVGPREDVVQALMETLVHPLLPLRVSSISPSEDSQIAVAKQMRAVVLLYNYYHRKQKPDLAFLEFVDFCKLAIVIRPRLIAFMKLMKGGKLQELNEAEHLLSVTEKAIKDACDIALGLDASRGVPNMEGWAISKVAVLLIDSNKENCMLQYGGTEGAWSLFEKELDGSCISPEISMGSKLGNKRKRDDLKLSTCNTDFLQLGYDLVKDVTGFSFSELEVLETHTTYSLSKEKSAACFYIMQYHGLFDEPKQVSLKFLVESVQGPLAEKFANGLWKSNPLAKLHQMLPYMGLISCWHLGCEAEEKSSDRKASPVDTFQSTEEDGDLTNKFDKRFKILPCAESSQNGIHENLPYGSEEADKGLSSSPSRVLSEMVTREDTIVEESGKGWDMADHDVTQIAEKDERRICPEILDEDRVGCGKDVLSAPMVLEMTNRNVLTNTNIKVYHHRRKKNSSLKKVTQLKEAVPGPEVDMVDALESNIESEKVSGDKDCLTDMCNQTDTASNGDQRTQLDAKTEHNVDVESTSDSFTSNDKRQRNEKESRDKGYLTDTCNQAVSASPENQQVRLDAVIQHDVEEESTLDSSRPDHSQRQDEKLSGEEGDEKLSGDNQAGTAPAENQQFQLGAVVKHDVEEQNTLDSSRPVHNQSIDEKLSRDEGDHTQKRYRTGIAATENQLPEVEAATEHNVEVQSTLNSLGSDHIQSRDEKLSGDKCDHIQESNHTDVAATGNQIVRVEAETKHNVEVQSTLNSLGSDHIQIRDEKLSGDECDHVQELNHTGIAATGNQVARIEAETKHNVEEQSTLNYLWSSHVQSRDDKLSGDKGDHIQECNHSVISTPKNQQAHVEAEIKHNRDVQITLSSSRPDPIQTRDEKLSGEKGDHAHERNRTGFAAKGNRLPQVETKSKHDIGVNTISDSDHLQNALALLYRKRQELYSKICNMEDMLAICEDNVARIRDGGEVDLARQCMKAVLTGKLHSQMENGTQVQNKGNQQDANGKSQHGKPTKLSEAYLTGNSSCQDLEYTCRRNDWRLPRYLIESSHGKFMSNVVVEGKDFKLHAKGSLEPNPYEARETAAAQMITVMRHTFL